MSPRWWRAVDGPSGPIVSGGARGAEFEEVVGGADQPPFALHCIEATAGESSVAEVVLDVAEDEHAVLSFRRASRR